MRSADRIPQCLVLGAKRKTSTRSEYFAFLPEPEIKPRTSPASVNANLSLAEPLAPAKDYCTQVIIRKLTLRCTEPQTSVSKMFGN
jgi:hypothetical protein